jgi:hypothetical protein
VFGAFVAVADCSDDGRVCRTSWLRAAARLGVGGSPRVWRRWRSAPGVRGCPARPRTRLQALMAGARCSGSGAARQPWKAVRPAVQSCTVLVTCGACRASPSASVRLTLARGGGPLAERVSTCSRWGLGQPATTSMSTVRRSPMQQRDAAEVERGPDPLLARRPRPAPAPVRRYALLRESRIYREAPSNPAGQSVVAVAVARGCGDRRPRGPARARRLLPCRPRHQIGYNPGW